MPRHFLSRRKVNSVIGTQSEELSSAAAPRLECKAQTRLAQQAIGLAAWVLHGDWKGDRLETLPFISKPLIRQTEHEELVK